MIFGRKNILTLHSELEKLLILNRIYTTTLPPLKTKTNRLIFFLSSPF
jgi:hypothetical protein